MNLQTPHPDFPSKSRAYLYDTAVRMFLDCHEDAEVAQALSLEVGRDISPAVARQLRREAAAAALDIEDVATKRRWIHRYRTLTLNNLVKEYMFLENKRDFLRTKAELAKDILGLADATNESRLWIALNEAVGRMDVDLCILHELMDYGRVALDMEQWIPRLTAISGLNTRDQIVQISRQFATLRTHSDSSAGSDILHLARLLMQPETAITPSHLDFIQEYAAHNTGTPPPDTTITLRILADADLDGEPLTLMESVLGHCLDSLTETQAAEILSSLQDGPLRPEAELIRIRLFCTRLLAARQNDHGQTALQRLSRACEEQLSLYHVERFFTPKEIETARSRLISAAKQFEPLARLNSLVTEAAVRSVLQFTARTGDEQTRFPANRYVSRRFGKTFEDI